MGIQNQITNPQRCRDCPFFEINHSSLGISFFCRFYKKGAFDLKNEKFNFCKVSQITVTESINKEKTFNGRKR